MSEHNKALMRYAIEEVWNHKNFSLLKDAVADNFVIHGATPEADIHGAQGAQQFLELLHHAMPDIHFAIEDQLAEGDKVVTRWKAQGTHTGDLMGIPPSGRRVTLTATDIDRFANSKVVECWTTLDAATIMQQMGLVPAADRSAP